MREERVVTPDELDDPAVRAAVRAAFDGYESALMANDVAALDTFFWSDARAVRFGVDEELFGADDIAAYRRSCAPPGPRRFECTKIATFGADVAIVDAVYREGDRGHLGRQSQTWVRLDGCWRIVGAHVSHRDPGA